MLHITTRTLTKNLLSRKSITTFSIFFYTLIYQLDKIIKNSENLIVLVFSKNKVKYLDNIKKVIIGSESGFNERKRSFLKT